jgi:hypothetical protein
MKLLPFRSAATSIATIAFLVSGIQISIGGEAKTTVHNFADTSVIGGASAALMRMENGVSTRLETVGLPAGDAVTMWWVVFNEPQNCSGGECGENDVFNLDADEKFILNNDGSPPFNGAAHKAAQISLNYADGHVIDEGGAAIFLGQLPAGDKSRTLFGPGLVDPMKAEIHLVLRTHQKAVAGKIDEMITTINGGCAGAFPNPPCEDLQFAIFMPSGS